MNTEKVFMATAELTHLGEDNPEVITIGVFKKRRSAVRAAVKYIKGIITEHGLRIAQIGKASWGNGTNIYAQPFFPQTYENLLCAIEEFEVQE